MERIWAPWRMEFILSSKTEVCIFCKDLEPPSGLLIYKDSLSGVILNKYPYNNGHLMVVPYLHTPTFEGLADDVLFEVIKTVRFSVDMLKKALKPDGFNIGLNFGKVAGAGMEAHMHLHVVPRWTGDTDSMPIIAETRVMPEHLSKTFNKLNKFFKVHC